MFKDIDKRLALISSMVRQGSLLADVGCDHGILITHLLEENIIKGGVALDINEMPLQKARLRIKSLGMEDKISCRLGDGLKLVGENEADDIVIAGMGGELIFKIISECEWKYNKDKRFIVNPMTKAPFLRIAMAKEGYELLEERAAEVNGKHYSIMKYGFTGEKKEYTELDTFPYTGILPQYLDEDAREYIEGQATMIKKKAEGLSHADQEESARYMSLYEKLTEVLK